MTQAELNIRQTLVDSMPRDQVIAAIVHHLRLTCLRGSHAMANGTPRQWYSAPFAVMARNGGRG